MKIHETRHIELVGNSSNDTWGHISLKYLADPKTMKITCQGETLIPESFNIYGEPIFSEETALLYTWRGRELSRNAENLSSYLPVEVSYEKREFTVPWTEFDTIEGIESSLKNLGTFHKMLDYRRLWHKARNKYLNEFIVLGRYYLDIFGQVLTITETEIPAKDVPKVCSVFYYKSLLSKNGFTSSYRALVPKKGDVCPCCGKKFTMTDLRKNVSFDLVNGKIAHETCKKTYYHHLEIDKLTRCLVDLVYDEKPKFDLLPNGYWPGLVYIPWFLFHTSNGDILIGWRKRVISIEWQENFKPFDMAIFSSEDVTKWCGDIGIQFKHFDSGILPTNVKRGIHAWGVDKAIEYLRMVKDVVNSAETK